LVGIAFGNYCSLLIYQDDVLKEQLFLFGKNIGMALQIKNDISDFIIDPSISGIHTYQDLLQGHPNIVIAYLFEYQNNFSQKEVQLLKNLLFHKYEKEKIIENDEDMILNMLKKSNAIDNTLLLYNKLLNNCLDNLVFIENIKVREKYVAFIEILLHE
jgi:geranylgeranyl pyrophosphate synthase